MLSRTASTLVAGALASVAAIVLASAQPAPAPAAAPAPAPAAPTNVSGQLRTGAPEDISLTMTMDTAGVLTLSQTEFHLAWGGYYRFNLNCPATVINEAGISFEAAELWENSHMRIVSVSDVGGGFQDVNEINFHVQGLQIRMIDCEGLPLAARFSFYPMRKGTYPFSVLNDAVTPAVTLTGAFIVE
jgi:hypothetical protein